MSTKDILDSKWRQSNIFLKSREGLKGSMIVLVDEAGREVLAGLNVKEATSLGRGLRDVARNEELWDDFYPNDEKPMSENKTSEEKVSWLAGLLSGWGIKESWAKIIAGAIIGALAAAGVFTVSGCGTAGDFTLSSDQGVLSVSYDENGNLIITNTPVVNQQKGK